MNDGTYILVPQTTSAIAALIAALIAADIESGGARLLPQPDTLTFGPGADVIATPEETLARGSGSDADLVRLIGAAEGDAVCCVGTPGSGYRVFLRRAGQVFDPAVGRGAASQPPSFYDGAGSAPIRRPPAYRLGRRGPQGMTYETRGTAPTQGIAIGEPNGPTPNGATPNGATPVFAGPTTTGAIFAEALAALAAESPATVALMTNAAAALGQFYGEALTSSPDAAFDAFAGRVAALDPVSDPDGRASDELALAGLHVVLRQRELISELLGDTDLRTRGALLLAQLCLDALPAPVVAEAELPPELPAALLIQEQGELPDIVPTFRAGTFRSATRGAALKPGCSGSCDRPW